jgi:3-oxoacyl-[acyl-carrier-protein] synthase II
MKKTPRIAITGIGMISPLGVTVSANWENLLNGIPGIDTIRTFDTSDCLTRIGGQLPTAFYEMEKKYFNRRAFKQTIRTTRIASLISKEAIQDSGLNLDTMDLKRCGVLLGTSGSFLDEDDSSSGSATYRIIREMANAPPARISLDLGFRGPSYSLTASSESGACAIANAADMIRWGNADVVIAGGVDTLLTRDYIHRFNYHNLLTIHNSNPRMAVKPFDKNRDGFALADGGCVVVLENAEYAHRRHARIYAYLTGFGISTGQDASGQSQVGMSNAMKMALEKADLAPEKIDYICASGAATVVDDLNEAKAIRNVFGPHVKQMMVSSFKSMIGHTMSANGAIGLAVCALALKTGSIPPAVNLTNPDPECGLNFVKSNTPQTYHLSAVMNNAFGFDSAYWSMILKSPQSPR